MQPTDSNTGNARRYLLSRVDLALLFGFGAIVGAVLSRWLWT